MAPAETIAARARRSRARAAIPSAGAILAAGAIAAAGPDFEAAGPDIEGPCSLRGPCGAFRDENPAHKGPSGPCGASVGIHLPQKGPRAPPIGPMLLRELIKQHYC